ncbi:MAG TPA: hypothetical protein VH985_21205 [Candidatus Binatia bacterium]|jgi:hypothetical protein
MNAAISENMQAGEIFEALFQPDVTAPAAYIDRLKRSTPLEPERLLLLAVLQDAIESFQKYFPSTREKERQLYAEARAWIFDDQRDWIFSFANVCDLLDLNPAYVRKGLSQWQTAQSEGKNAAHSNRDKNSNKNKRGGNIYGRKTKDTNHRRRHTGGRQCVLVDRRRARAGAGARLAAVRKARAL